MTNKKIKVYVGQPSTGTCVDFQPYMLRAIQEAYKDTVELVYPEACAHRIFHDFARNGVVEDFLLSDCDVLWFLDSDIVPPVHVLDLVTKHEGWKVAGATYPIFMSPGMVADGGREVVFTCYKRNEQGCLKPGQVPDEGVEYVDGLATGCLFIKREVFAQIERPFFKFTYNETTRGLHTGEDIDFCIRMNALGYQFLTDYSMVCKHYKNVELLEVNNYAMAFAKRSVEEFHRQAQKEVSGMVAAIKKSYEKKLAEAKTPSASPSGLILPSQFR